MSIASPEISGVLQGPFGSLVRDHHGIDTTKSDQLFSEKGQDALRQALRAYRESGATIGGAPTYRLTNLRTNDSADSWDVSPHTIHRLPQQYVEWNHAAVRIARGVYGTVTPVFGLLAPIADTGGAHDAQWSSLGTAKRPFVRQRQGPQIKALREAGIHDFLVEAGRYLAEAEELSALIAETGGGTLGFSFEANQSHVPDPEHTHLTFAQAQERIHDAARGRITTLTGINCVGATAVRGALDRGDLPPIVYPNLLDFGRPGGTRSLPVFSRLAERADIRSEEDDAHLAAIRSLFGTHEAEFRGLYRDCLQAGARIIGICCGGSPRQTVIAREAFDSRFAE